MAKISKKFHKIKNSKKSQSHHQSAQQVSIVPETKVTECNKQKLELPQFEESILNAYKSKRYVDCIKSIERILKFKPESESSHYKILLAAANTMLGTNFKRSHNLLNEVLKLNPFDAYALYGKGVAFYFEQKFDESLMYFDRAIEIDAEGMERAKEMKIRAQLESKHVRVVVKKLDIVFNDHEEYGLNDTNHGNDSQSLSNITKGNDTLELDDDNESCNEKLKQLLINEKTDSDVKDEFKETEEMKSNKKNLENPVKMICEEEKTSEKPTRTLRNRKINETESTEKDRKSMAENETIKRNDIKLTSYIKNDTKEGHEDERSDSNGKFLNPTNSDSSLTRQHEKLPKPDSIHRHKEENCNSTNTVLNEKEDTIEEQQDSIQNNFSNQSFKEIRQNSSCTLDTSSDEDSSELKPTTSANSFAQLYFNRGLDHYMSGELKKSIKLFQKSLKFEPDFEEADEVGTKAQEFMELLDIVDINMNEKNYSAVVEICNEGLDIDEGNDIINRKLYFQRGLAYFHLSENEKSLIDYEEYERLSSKLGVKLM